MEEMILTKAEGAPPQVFRPWRRFWARMFDWWLCGRLWFLIQLLILNIDAAGRPATLGSMILGIIVQLILMLILEPLFLSRWGTTPGKWLLGLYVTHERGRKLSYTEALYRTSGVLVSGMGLAIPIYDLVRLYLSYKTCASGVRLSWDDETAYTIKAENSRQIVLYLGAVLLVIALLLMARGQAQLPKHRGDLTAAQFVENVNKLNDFYDWLPGSYLDENGQWQQERTSTGGTYSMAEPTVDFAFTEVDGKLTEVRFDLDKSVKQSISSNERQMCLAILAFAGAQKSIHFWDMLSPSWADIVAGPFQEFAFNWGGVDISCQVSYSGYHQVGNYPVLFPEEEGPYHYQMAFVMRKP